MNDQEFMSATTLIKLLKKLATAQQMRTNYNVIEDIEKFEKLFSVLDRDWASLARRIKKLSFAALHSSTSTYNKTEISETGMELLEICSQIAQHEEAIEAYHQILEQIICRLSISDKKADKKKTSSPNNFFISLFAIFKHIPTFAASKKN